MLDSTNPLKIDMTKKIILPENDKGLQTSGQRLYRNEYENVDKSMWLGSK
ncbi:MAG: hypothetical protein AAB516_01695 [Patescibacteria group bacterium]